MLRIVVGLMFIYIAFHIYNTGLYDAYYGYKVELGIFKMPTSILCFSIGIYFILLYKEQKIEYSKCQRCKTNYTYSDLKDGICPKCDIKTIDMEEYYKKYPDELDDI